MDFITGSLAIEDNPGEKEVITILQDALQDFEGICGYKYPSCGVPSKNDVPSFVIVSKQLGIILIDVIDDKLTENSDDEFWEYQNETNQLSNHYSRDIVLSNFQSEVSNRLAQNTKLFNRKTNQYIVEINRLIIFIRNDELEINYLNNNQLIYSDFLGSDQYRDGLSSYIASKKIETELNNEQLDLLFSEIEGTSIFENRKQKPGTQELITKDDFIRASLAYTFKLDDTQRKISMQLPDGPQRIRGLAGTGKTVILSMKAALTHKEFPHFKVLLAFNTQSMYGTIENLVAKYFSKETRNVIDPDMLHIRHAWGGANKAGVYSDICGDYGLKPLTFNEVPRNKDGIEYLFSDLLKRLKEQNSIIPKYDMVLIDEAQDFPPVFFETLFLITKNPKRIVWAYDEFQSLKEIKIKEPEELFGIDGNGNPNMSNSSLEGKYNDLIDKDFVLPNSYRNPRLPLMLAHGLALGLKRTAGIIETFPDKRSWEAIGYKVLEPAEKEVFSEGDEIKIERPEENSKNRLEQLLRSKDLSTHLVEYEAHNNFAEELSSVAKKINQLIREENVCPEEIIVITLDTRNALSHLKSLRIMLENEQIKCVMPGLIEGNSIFKRPGFVTLTTPFRAKGNEGHIVFVLNCQKAIGDSTFRGRNSLFVAITRAQGWCYLSGTGSSMPPLLGEIEDIQEIYPNFTFTYPDPETLQRNRTLLLKDDREIEKQDQLLDELLSSNPALVIEKLLANPELLKKLKIEK